MFKRLFLNILLIPCLSLNAQFIDHWETIVYNHDEWKYFIATEEPPGDWMMVDFDDESWLSGEGGFGYGDGDDNTYIQDLSTIYLRKEFKLIDTSSLAFLILHTDFDDAFVAYLNGKEIGRNNIGTPGTPPAFDVLADEVHEADLYDGDPPESLFLRGDLLKSLIKQGTNTLAIQVHNESYTSSDFSSNFFLSAGITDTSSNYGQTPDWFSSTLLSSNLPLLIINTTEAYEIFDEPKVTAHLGIVDNGPGQTNAVFDEYSNYNGRIAIEIRGSSSQYFPKKNYSFETQLPNGENNNVSLLGMPKENDWILHGPYSDKSLLRNVLAYHMGSVTGQYTPRTRLCELIVNSDYKGVYILTEKIKRDNNRVNISKLKPSDNYGDKLTGGYLLQIDRDDDEIENDGWQSNYPDWKFFVYQDPDYDEITPKQQAYIQNFINVFESLMYNPLYTGYYPYYVNVESWIDYFLVTEIGKHIDAYKLSFFMYKKRDSNGGKLHFGPLWDFNLGFGNFDFTCSPEPEGWAYKFRETCDDWHPFWVTKLTDLPQVSHQINCRWFELRDGPLHTDTLLQFINDKAELLADAQERNFERWDILEDYVWPNNFVGETYEAEIGYLKTWLTERLNWMDENMLGDCNLYTDSSSELLSSTDVKVFPNPANEIIFLELPAPPASNTILNLYNIFGDHITSFSLKKRLNQLNIGEIPTGMYIYTILKNGSQASKGKIIKN